MNCSTRRERNETVQYLVELLNSRWIFHGFFMDFSWIFHGFFMDFSKPSTEVFWIFHGFFRTFEILIWIFHGFFMDFLVHRLDFSWIFHGFLRTLRISHGFFMDFSEKSEIFHSKTWTPLQRLTNDEMRRCRKLLHFHRTKKQSFQPETIIGET